jgi:hypothetical protein
MRPKAIYFWFTAAFLWITTTPCFSNPWLFRPGQWKETVITDGVIVHIPPGTSPDLSAKLRAMALPRAYSHQLCVRPGEAPIGPTIDPVGEKMYTCSEKTVYKDADVELVQDECEIRPNSIPGWDHLPPYLKTVRFVRRTGPSKGTVWGVDEVLKIASTNTNVKTVLRWIGRKCGDARSSGNPH